MRKIFIIILFYTLSIPVSAQSIPELQKLADEQYENNLFMEAIPYYKRIYALDKKNYYAGYRLAACLEQTLQYEDAMKNFKSLSEINDHEYQAQATYKYATLNKLESNFDIADSIYQKLAKMPGIDPKLLALANRQREGCLIAKREKEQKRNFELHYLKKLNGNYHDFGATTNPANGNIVFATTRNLSGTQYKGSQYSGLLPDMMMYEVKSNGNYNNVSGKNKFDKLNTKWSEGSGTFNATGDKFYYTSCEGQGNTGCKIVLSQLIEDKWSDSEPLNEYINEVDAENKQPSLSFTGDTLFFASNRPGGEGGSDIWMSLRGDEGESWLPAINLGNVINSAENEITPYYSSAHESLLFSSNGHVGYGGYDIYGAKGNSFFNPDLFNIGYPFNSTWDDTYFNITDTTGYLSSNRENKEVLDLYHFSVPNEKLFLSLLFAGELMVNGQIVSKFRNASSIDIVTFRAEDYEGYALFQPVNPEKKDLRKLFNETNAVGQSIAANYDQTRSARSARSKRVEPEQKQSSVYRPRPENTEKLYFEYGDYRLRSEVRIALDEFHNALKGKDYSKVNLLCYSDHLGGRQHNVSLSQQRGDAVKAYLMRKGIPQDKINVLARGELISKDGEDNWFRRILNRRVELHIESPSPIELSAAENVILRKPMTLQAVATQLNLPQSEVYKWNGNKKDELSSGNTIRLFVPSNIKLDPQYFITQKNISKVF